MQPGEPVFLLYFALELIAGGPCGCDGAKRPGERDNRFDEIALDYAGQFVLLMHSGHSGPGDLGTRTISLPVLLLTAGKDGHFSYFVRHAGRV